MSRVQKGGIGLLSILVIATLFISIGVIAPQTAHAEGQMDNLEYGGTLAKRSSRDTEEVIDITENAYGQELAVTEKSQRHFNGVQPPEQMDWSLEREQILERNRRWNNPNKLSYIYLFSEMGQIIAYLPIKGKVSSVNSKLTATNQIVYYDNSYEDSVNGIVESPAMDGSYGTNGDAIFFFLTDGTYMEWASPYLLSDNPVKLSIQPLVTYEITE
ncbi:MAG: hypothetical protein GY804_02715 [Alphaproteobacteria bacterium]|nr:hypothetical protein [Alphaproteobacteria bacterium]